MTSSMPARGRILVVDDDRAFRHAMATLLEEAGHVVVQAADGISALGELASATPFDVMLLDVGLPGMSGPRRAGAGRQPRGPSARADDHRR